MKLNNEIEKPDNATLVIRRMLKAPREIAFKAWTTPEHIRQWMCPEDGMKVPSARMELRVGGRYRIQMQQTDGEYFTAAGEFQEVIPPARLVYTWDFEKDGGGEEYGELEGKTTLITVEFHDRGDQTEFVLTHTRFADIARRDSHVGGWSRITDCLVRFLEKA